MVCVYCGGRTQVTNSRSQKRLHQVWRRRACSTCKAIFTTNESVDFKTTLSVRTQTGKLEPFNRDTLFVSVLAAVGHRPQSVADAGALTATITGRLIHTANSAAIDAATITDTALETLKRFDSAAAVQYEAYHKK